MKYYFSLCLLSFLNMYSWPWQNSLKQYDCNASLPQEIKNILDEHIYELNKVKQSVNHFNWLSDWIIKASNEDYPRIKGGQRFSAAINELNCKRLVVPKQYSYQAPNGKHYIVSEFLADSKKNITLKELKEFMRLAKKLQWIDPDAGNFIKVADNKIGLPDTKLDYIGRDLENEYQEKAIIFHKVNTFQIKFTPQAKDYLENRSKLYNENWYNPAWVQQRKQKKYWKPLFVGFTKALYEQVGGW
ncbi:MAG: hypothetical protein WDZ41_02565 [Candidatus Babeliales bacterium]